ncbi:MAG: hypothetical protein PHW86_00480, partial [Candidatus Bipolaricaulis sp.]|nr:hypothetical protein [Candidatus Bipolaricaulis sp.]
MLSQLSYSPSSTYKAIGEAIRPLLPTRRSAKPFALFYLQGDRRSHSPSSTYKAIGEAIRPL